MKKHVEREEMSTAGRTRREGTSWLLVLVVLAVTAAIGFGIYRFYLPPRIRVSTGSNLVRGYLAVAVGPSTKGESAGIPSRTIKDKQIYLPGITVYLEEQKSGKRSASVRTDLSGRFTLFAPVAARYRLCWESKIFGSGHTSDFITAGSAPQFLSTVNISIPPRKGFVAIVGEVSSADGSLPRTFEPLLNINAFASVGFEDETGNRGAEVYVNNFGDYLLPYVPIDQRLKLTARIESAKFEQEIWPEAQLGVASVHQVNLRFENHRPRLNPMVAFDLATSRRVQNVVPAATVKLQAGAVDKDGDAVQFAWFVDPSAGQLSQSTGSDAEWKLPQSPGHYSATVVAYDNKGGYDKAIVSVLVGAEGIPFTGIVLEPRGAPVADASIEVVGNPAIRTDSGGRFQINVKEADRYVLNIRKEGYALNSQVYDRSITGGKWILRRGQVVTIDPTRDVKIMHERTDRDCPGPDSVHADLGISRESLTIPQWQDGKGNTIDPPPWWDGPVAVDQKGKIQNQKVLNTDANRGSDRQPVVVPRDLKLPRCGPGVSVEIPANSILDANGNVAAGPLNVSISTVDLLSPQQMPGEYSAVGRDAVGRMESFGAGSLDLPAGFRLREGASAKITIPVDRSRLGGKPPPATVPLLSYDEQKGLWVEEDVLTLSTVGGLNVYEGRVKHFSTFNADVLFTNNACLRVFSPSLPGQYELEVTAPYPDGTAHTKKYLIDNVTSTEHVIYNLVPNTNITLAPMTPGPNSQLLGYYIVNSGPVTSFVGTPGAGNAPPGPPYTDCNNFVVLKVGSAPDSPFGGEFLHGLGYVDAANLGFDDLTTAAPTGNALRDAIVTASKNYYTTLDPSGAANSFEKFKNIHGFSQNPGTPTANEIVAQYANSGDLGFGRDMHCLAGGNGDVVCYVTNYGTGYSNIYPGPGTPDADDAQAAGNRATVGQSAEVATVAMEYSDLPGAPGNKVVKFYVYKKALTDPAAVTATNPTGAYARSISANLDGRGERPVPQLCMICHGGQIPQQAGGVPAFGNNAQVTFGSRFLPFDHRFFTFPASPAGLSKANQETRIKNLNEQIVNAAPPAGAGDPIAEVVSGFYNNGTSAVQIANFTVPGWATGQSANAPNQQNFYQQVIANECRTCHIAQPYAQLQFNTSDKFLNLSAFPAGAAGGAANRLMLGTAQLRVCGDYVMPHALRTHEIFWDLYWDVPSWGPPPAPASVAFQNFGDTVPAAGTSTWKPALCTTFLAGTVSSPSQFYEHTIQPIWNGKCVACHIASGPAGFLPLTQGVSWSGLVPGEVVPGNDNPNAAGNTLLKRLSFTDPRDPNFNPGSGQRMPQGCIVPPTPPGPGHLPCLEQSDIDKIKAWIRSGAN
ncbi:MAG TPA: carboxypeptidase-like regulatory domain-containing protein [Chthoniobacterales bacterium]|nr:carboxypeptidase-like regulatory domain-containing protein [Chthoniobacterales bacterium]